MSNQTVKAALEAVQNTEELDIRYGSFNIWRLDLCGKMLFSSSYYTAIDLGYQILIMRYQLRRVILIQNNFLQREIAIYASRNQ